MMLNLSGKKTGDKKARKALSKQAATMKTSDFTTSIDEAGRIPLPQLVQSQLGVKPGDKLTLRELNGQWLLNRVTTVTDSHDDDLGWEELNYAPIPPNPLGQVTARIERRGKLKPMAHDLDD
jgi:bifunctional DNA-binding transcriptional regulator/antitoxin component of YhaV-PrlF toxin-antitoxin module